MESCRYINIINTTFRRLLTFLNRLIQISLLKIPFKFTFFFKFLVVRRESEFL